MNRGQEFVIGGYFPGPHGFDSLIVGYYDKDNLTYVARTSERICSGLSETSVFEIETSSDADLPIRESAGDEAIMIW